MFGKKLIAVMVVLTFILVAPMAMGKCVNAPATDKELSECPAFFVESREPIVLAQNDDATAGEGKKSKSESETSESEPAADDKNKSSNAVSKPLEPFVPSEKIPGEQAVDFPVDI